MPQRVHAQDVRRVYEHWRQARGKTHGRYRTITPGRRQKIEARLREFTPEDLIRAIDAVALDPWEERDRWDDLTVIFRSREKVERWLDMADNPPKPRKRYLTPAEIARMDV